MCAFHNEVTAISVCVRLPECNAFTVYANGATVGGRKGGRREEGGGEGGREGQVGVCTGGSTGVCALRKRTSPLQLTHPSLHESLTQPAHRRCRGAGTNGCEAELLAVLKTQVPSDANTFVSSDVYTVVLTNTEQALVRRIRSSLAPGCALRPASIATAHLLARPASLQLSTCLPHPTPRHTNCWIRRGTPFCLRTRASWTCPARRR